MLGLSVIDMSQNAVANLGWTDVKLTHPVYIGDTLYAESVCVDKQPMKLELKHNVILTRRSHSFKHISNNTNNRETL